MLHNPAIFTPVLGKWIQEAFTYFYKGNTLLYFYTDSNLLSNTNKLDIKHVYFKPKGNCFITAMANFVNIKFNNPKTFRLPNTQNITGKYYYGFKRIKTLNKQIPLSDITRYPSNKFLRNDVPGVCLINDPF